MLGETFKKARQEIQNPVTLRRLIVDLIGAETWSSTQADMKGDIYEGLLAKSAAESPKGAGHTLERQIAGSGGQTPVKAPVVELGDGPGVGSLGTGVAGGRFLANNSVFDTNVSIPLVIEVSLSTLAMLRAIPHRHSTMRTPRCEA